MPLRSMSKVWSHFSSSSVASGTRWAMPALATIASMPPYVFSAAATTAFAASRRADVELVELGLAALARDLVGDRRAFFLEDVGHDDVCSRPWRRPCAVARPMPMPAPVMRTVSAHSITSPEFGPIVWPTNRLASLASRGKPPLRRPPRARQIARAAAPLALALRQSSDSAMHERGVDRAGRDGVDADAKRAHLAGERLGQADDRRLRGAVVDELDAADLSELRGHVDDDAGLAREHRGQDAPCVIRNTPRTWTANMRSKSAGVRSTNRAWWT